MEFVYRQDIPNLTLMGTIVWSTIVMQEFSDGRRSHYEGRLVTQDSAYFDIIDVKFDPDRPEDPYSIETSFRFRHMLGGLYARSYLYNDVLLTTIRYVNPKISAQSN